MWSKAYGDNVIQWVNAVGTDHQGRILLAGDLEGELDFGGLTVHHDGPRPYVIQLDKDAQPLWARIIGGTVDQTLVAIAADKPGNVYVAGSSERTKLDGIEYRGGGFGNLLVFKLRSNGDTDWVRFVGDTGDQMITSMSLDRSGNVLIAGSFNGVMDFGNLRLESEYGSGFAAKLDRNGRARWGRLISANAVVADNPGNAWVAGSLRDGSLGVAGELASDADAFVAVLSKPKGDLLFGEVWGDDANQSATDIAVGQHGEVVIVGQFQGTMRFGDDELTSEGDEDWFVARVR